MRYTYMKSSSALGLDSKCRLVIFKWADTFVLFLFRSSFARPIIDWWVFRYATCNNYNWLNARWCMISLALDTTHGFTILSPLPFLLPFLLIFPCVVYWAHRRTPNFCITAMQTRTILHSRTLSYHCVGFSNQPWVPSLSSFTPYYAYIHFMIPWCPLCRLTLHIRA